MIKVSYGIVTYAGPRRYTGRTDTMSGGMQRLGGGGGHTAVNRG